MIKLKWGFVLLLMSSSFAYAGGDSFVGNGGSAGDLELSVAKKQLQETFYEIQSMPLANQLCTCEPIFEGRGECAPLADLTKDETLFCSDKLKKMSARAFRLLKENKIVFRWTKEDIFVKQGIKVLTADAVANTANDSITLNQKRFLNLSDTERLFLLSHEILHLTPFEKESFLSDEGAVGPYSGDQGARRLINAMASGTVVEAHRNKSIQSYRSALRRRKSYAKSWLDLTLNRSGAAADVEDSVYAQDSFSGGALSFTRYFGKLGLSGRYSRQSANKGILTTITSKEVQDIYGVGLSYKIFPFKNPMTFSGQSFLAMSVYLEYTKAEAEVRDNFTGLNAKSDSFGGSIDFKYHLPVQLCWMHLGAGLRKYDLEYSEIGLTNDKIQPFLNIGASYAF